MRVHTPDPSFIVGFGTGRCGTVSLAEYLNVWHEWKSPRYLSEGSPDDWLSEVHAAAKQFGKHPGDISLDHINSLDYWLDQDVVRLVLIRDREDFTRSLLRYRSIVIWERLFPAHDFRSADGIRAYWDWYYDQIFKHEGDFCILGTESLAIRRNTHEATHNR